MTTPTREQVVQWAEQSGLQNEGRAEFAYMDRIYEFMKLARADLEAERQRVAEACAKVCDQGGTIGAGMCSEAIRAGQWREHLYGIPSFSPSFSPSLFSPPSRSPSWTITQ